MDSNIRKRAYTCLTCNGSHQIAHLTSGNYVIELTVHSGEDSHLLNLGADVARKIFPEMDDPQEIADECLFIEGKTVQFNPKNYFIINIE